MGKTDVLPAQYCTAVIRLLYKRLLIEIYLNFDNFLTYSLLILDKVKNYGIRWKMLHYFHCIWDLNKIYRVQMLHGHQ